jgi:hypothetical protein
MNGMRKKPRRLTTPVPLRMPVDSIMHFGLAVNSEPKALNLKYEKI